MNHAVTLTTGQRYDLSKLMLMCWHDADGNVFDPCGGCHCCDYFRDGVYLGPDMYGVHPLFWSDSVHPLAP